MFDIKTKTSDYMSIVLTHRCNRHCEFCVDKKRYTHGEITLKNVKNALMFAKENRFRDILLVGGEPTLHKNVIDIAKLCHDEGFNTILTSNCDNIDVLYELDPYVDSFNFSFYNQKRLPSVKNFKHADITLSTLIYKGRFNSKKDLDDFIDLYGSKFNLKFSTLTIANKFCEEHQSVEFLDELDSEWSVLFNEILGQTYRGCLIKRYDKVINHIAKQSYKCDSNGIISTHW